MVRQDLKTATTLFFLCNGDWTYNSEEAGTISNNQLSQLMKAKISEGQYFKTNWQCGNTKKIEIGARAYLLRSGSNPTGIIAAGNVIAAPKDEQQRNKDKRYSDLSETYVDYDRDIFYVYIEFDSVVDFVTPLEQNNLKKLPQFKEVEFGFQRGGVEFAPSNPGAVQALESEWEKHSLIHQRQGKGRRLVDVFLEKGKKDRQEKNYESAIRNYQKALEIDPHYSKAINSLGICKSILERGSTRKPDPVQTDELASIRDKLESQKFFSSSNINEARKKVLTLIVRRQGQTKFRQILLEAYGYRCAITGFDAEAALEAAHIVPYIETENNDPSNGLLLRADLHTLFDLNLLAIHPEKMQVLLCPTLRETEYRVIHEKQVHIPNQAALRPNLQLLKQRLKQCSWIDAD